LAGYSVRVKTTSSSRNATTTKQAGNSRQKAPGADTRDASQSKGGSSSERATSRAKRGEPLSAGKKSDRSPKQENL
jgi:hypothetical protein